MPTTIYIKTWICSLCNAQRDTEPKLFVPTGEYEQDEKGNPTDKHIFARACPQCGGPIYLMTDPEKMVSVSVLTDEEVEKFQINTGERTKDEDGNSIRVTREMTAEEKKAMLSHTQTALADARAKEYTIE